MDDRVRIRYLLATCRLADASAVGLPSIYPSFFEEMLEFVQYFCHRVRIRLQLKYVRIYYDKLISGVSGPDSSLLDFDILIVYLSTSTIEFIWSTIINKLYYEVPGMLLLVKWICLVPQWHSFRARSLTLLAAATVDTLMESSSLVIYPISRGWRLMLL